MLLEVIEDVIKLSLIVAALYVGLGTYVRYRPSSRGTSLYPRDAAFLRTQGAG